MKFGSAFSDSVLESHDRIVGKTHEVRLKWWSGSGRALLFSLGITFAFFVLLWRLFDLTIIQGHSMRALADNNRIKERISHAPRGKILDRSGIVLAENTPMYRIIQPCTEKPVACITYISTNDWEKQQHTLMPGAYYEETFARMYPFAKSTSHVVGYTGELTDREIHDEYYEIRSYQSGGRIGRMGAEALYEQKLRGKDGRQLVEQAASGVVTRILGEYRAIAGEDIQLSIDSGLAEAVYNAFPKGYHGAVVVQKPDTGEILALYSAPNFDANALSLPMSAKDYDLLFNSSQKPLFNRAIAGVYPPGSTYKLVTSLAALEEGAVRPDTLIEDTGVITIGPYSFPNWYWKQYGKTEGMVNLEKALARSNDTYYYKAAETLGITKLIEWSSRVGVGKLTNIELPGEAVGLMPGPAWKQEQFSSKKDVMERNNAWYVGDTYHAAIGQGYVLMTPLQVNHVTSFVASGGFLCEPTIEKVIDRGSNKHSASCKKIALRDTTLAAIAKGMVAACDEGGTAYPFFNYQIVAKQDTKNDSDKEKKTRIPVACKTGTAEFGHPLNKTHAWFTVFAPVLPEYTHETTTDASVAVYTGKPEIAVTVLVEEGGEGSAVAAPVAKEILDYWFRR